jgi:LEA14-like dessication related protein
VSPKSFSVPAYGEAQVQVEMTTNALGILRKLQELMTSEADSVSYQLSGKLDVGLTGVGTIPFRNSGEFKFSDLGGAAGR